MKRRRQLSNQSQVNLRTHPSILTSPHIIPPPLLFNENPPTQEDSIYLEYLNSLTTNQMKQPYVELQKENIPRSLMNSIFKRSYSNNFKITITSGVLREHKLHKLFVDQRNQRFKCKNDVYHGVVIFKQHYGHSNTIWQSHLERSSHFQAMKIHADKPTT
jgi:hypothetical protein